MEAYVLSGATKEEFDAMSDMVGTNFCHENAYVSFFVSNEFGEAILTNCKHFAENHKGSGREVELVDLNQFNLSVAWTVLKNQVVGLVFCFTSKNQ